MLKDIFIGILIGLVVLSGILVWRNQDQEISTGGDSQSISSWSIFDKKQINPVNKKKTATNIYAPILMYHYIRENPDSNDTLGASLSVTPADFAAQLDWLVNNGFKTITLDELVAGLKGKNVSMAKPVILTFDDGYADFYTTAYPELVKRNMRATVYMISGKVDDSENRYLKSSQLNEMARSGLITVGSHTISHINFKTASPANATQEAVQSKKDLEKITGKPVIHFSYPSGQFDENSIKIIKSLGYISSVTTIEGTVHSNGSALNLSRVRVSGNTTMEKFREKLEKK